MSNLTSLINVEVPNEIKEEAKIIFDDLSLDINTAINIFLKMAIYKQDVLFETELQFSESFLESINR